MKKIVILAVVTVVMVFSSIIVPKLFEKTITRAEITAMSNIIYTEYVNATGEVDSNENGFIVNAAVSEDDISKVKIGQSVVISGKGFGDSEYTGTVDVISDIARKLQQSATGKTVVDVVITIENADEMIRKGNTAEVKIMISEQRQISVVAYKAVKQDEDGTEYVYVFCDGVAVRKNIVTGLELSDGIEVLSGLNPNDKVLTSQEELVNGNYVKVVE